VEAHDAKCRRRPGVSALPALGAPLQGTNKPLVSTGGTLMLAMAGINERPGTEDDVLPGGLRVEAENHVVALAGDGVRSSVIRLAPMVHSDLDHHGFTHARRQHLRHRRALPARARAGG
jgi:hypothetical protein